jgi:hypothetical protein
MDVLSIAPPHGGMQFPVAFTAVYVVGAIAAFGIGFLAIKKARSVQISSAQAETEDEGRA